MKAYLFLLAILALAAFPALKGMADDTTPAACPMIAKLCPDGSSISPQGPKCKMAACPNGGDKDLQGPDGEDECNGDDCDDDKKTDEKND